jgi:hypothetical protein
MKNDILNDRINKVKAYDDFKNKVARGGASGGASSSAVAGAPASIVFNGMPMQNQPSPYQ